MLHIRKGFTWLFGGILIALISNFAVELARERGIYEHPTATIETALNAFASIKAHPWFLPALCVFAGLVVGMWIDTLAGGRLRKSDTPKATAKLQTLEPDKAPRIDINVGTGAPYEVSDISHGHVLSTVRIGLKNSGGGALSNCKVYIERIIPLPPLVGGLPILLEGGGFTLRGDDPEKLIDIAAHWDHVAKYRFSAPLGWFAETLNYLDDNIDRKIEIKVVSTECVRSALFKIKTDSSKALRIECIGQS